jgi:hypothetical protein
MNSALPDRLLSYTVRCPLEKDKQLNKTPTSAESVRLPGSVEINMGSSPPPREAPHPLDEAGFDYEAAGEWLPGHDMAKLPDRDRRSVGR